MEEELVKKEDGLWHPKGGLIEEVEGPALLPKKLETSKAAEYVLTEPFESFALSDEQTVVKLYFGLKGAKGMLPAESVTVSFRVQALEVVAKPSPSKVYRFHESILFEYIVPDKCKVKVKTDHIVVTLVKANQHAYWENVSVNRKAIGPVRKSPPDFGRPTVVVTGGTKPAPAQ
mmetsp:Transcript_9664/g.30985  ORF Transcript_9664/g.30985 Transcript_9664/m.30985 type:complete len:174 (-) Transcript_9664:184-705(-)